MQKIYVALYDLELLQHLNSMKSSQAISHVRCLYETDVSRTISVVIIVVRDREDFIEYVALHYNLFLSHEFRRGRIK
jgi:hypothetical protein